MSTQAIEIADTVFSLLTASPTQFITFRRTPMLKVQSQDLPALGVYIIRETRTPDGDENVGEPRFMHRLTLGLSGAVMADDAGSQLTQLELMMADFDNRLLTSTPFLSMIEGVLSMDRRSQYASVVETPLAEIQIELVVSFRSQWPPAGAINLTSIKVTPISTGPGQPPGQNVLEIFMSENLDFSDQFNANELVLIGL